jgi:rhamnosyltransferase
MRSSLAELPRCARPVGLPIEPAHDPHPSDGDNPAARAGDAAAPVRMAVGMIGDLGIVVTTYRPDGGLWDRFGGPADRARALIVVDNTPGGHRFGQLPARCTVLQDGRNKGLGAALNLGLDEARRLGCKHVVLFDQDSTPSVALLERLVDTVERLGGAGVAVGPLLLDDQAADLDAQLHASEDALSGPLECRALRASALATSGMTFGIEDGDTTPRFSEELFIDFVDFDWCWRQARRGWRFHRDRSAAMPHRLGSGQRSVAGLTFHIPAPYRHYFQFRDTLRLIARPHVPTYAKWRLGLLLPVKLLVYPWILDRGWMRLRWMVMGLLDAARGRVGVGAAADVLGATGKSV